MIKKIYICEDITDKTVNRIKNYIAKIQSDIDKIYIYINSKGGDITSTQELIDLLKPYQSKTVTVALDYCQSAATWIFLFGNKRLVKSCCKFLIHRPFCDYKALTDENLKLTIHTLKILTKKLKKTEKEMKKHYKKYHVPNNLIKKIFSSTNDIMVPVKDLINYNMATEIFYNNETVLLYDNVTYSTCHTSNLSKLDYKVS